MKTAKRFFNIYAVIGLLIGFIAFLILLNQGAFAVAQETCPEGNGWVKVDDLDGHTYTYTPEEGYEVTDNCYKHATFVHYGTGDTVETDVHEVCKGKKCRDFRPDLSHASFKLEKVEQPEPTPTPTDTPQETALVCLDGEQEKEIPKTREAWKRVLFSFPNAYIGECEEDEEPTPTPPAPKLSNEHVNRAGNPPSVCSAPIPQAPENVHVWRKGDQAIVQWIPTDNVDRANVLWRYNVQSTWEYSLLDIPNNGYVVVNGLGNGDFTFGVQQYNGCVPSETIEVIDGGTDGWILFTP